MEGDGFFIDSPSSSTIGHVRLLTEFQMLTEITLGVCLNHKRSS